MQRYLVTGAGGNLARQLVGELRSQDKETLGIDLRPPPAQQADAWLQVDITDRSAMARLLAQFRPQCILHMASLLSMSSAADPPRAWRVNASAAVELLELAAEHGVQRFFFPSTSATYGGRLPDPLPEDHPQWPDNIYGATKVAVERVGTYFALSRGLDFRAVRLPIVVSPHAPPAAVSAYASHVFVAAARGESFTMPVAPEVAVSVIYVRDVTRGILRLAAAPEERLSRRVYNLHGFAASATALAQAAAQRVPGFEYRFEPEDLATRILAVQPSVYRDASARRDWRWEPQFDLAATADDSSPTSARAPATNSANCPAPPAVPADPGSRRAGCASVVRGVRRQHGLGAGRLRTPSLKLALCARCSQHVSCTPPYRTRPRGAAATPPSHRARRVTRAD